MGVMPDIDNIFGPVPDQSDFSRSQSADEIYRILVNAEAENRRCISMFKDLKVRPASRVLITKHLHVVLEQLVKALSSCNELLGFDDENFELVLGKSLPQHESKVNPIFRAKVIDFEFKISKILESMNHFVRDSIDEWDQIPLPTGVQMVEYLLNVDRSKVKNIPKPQYSIHGPIPRAQTAPPPQF